MNSRASTAAGSVRVRARRTAGTTCSRAIAAIASGPTSSVRWSTVYPAACRSSRRACTWRVGRVRQVVITVAPFCGCPPMLLPAGGTMLADLTMLADPAAERSRNDERFSPDTEISAPRAAISPYGESHDLPLLGRRRPDPPAPPAHRPGARLVSEIGRAHV